MVENARRKYRLEFTVEFDEANCQSLIDYARRLCSAGGGAFDVDDDENETPIPPEEYIETLDDALVEIVGRHPAVEESGMVVRSTCCSDETEDRDGEIAAACGDFEPTTSYETSDTDHDDLDQYESGIYLCRWPNGEFSVVAAESKREAIVALDEWAGAHPSQLYPIDGFMADFCLTDDGEIVLNEFGEAAQEKVWKTCYPALGDLLASDQVSDGLGNIKEGAAEVIRKAVNHERTRLWDNQPSDEPRTEIGKRLAKVMGTSSVAADHYVDELAKKLLERDDDDEDRKPN